MAGDPLTQLWRRTLLAPKPQPHAQLRSSAVIAASSHLRGTVLPPKARRVMPGTLQASGYALLARSCPKSHQSL